MARKGIGGIIFGSIIIFLGAVVITGGIIARPVVNNYLIEPMTDDAFTQIETMVLTDLTPEIKKMAYPQFMEGVLVQMQYAFGGDPGNLAAFINGSTAAGAMNQTAEALQPAPYADDSAALLGLFNDNITQLYGTPIPGISEAMNGGVPIGYIQPFVDALCFGGVGTSYDGVPWSGILEQDPIGDMTPGILIFLQHYVTGLGNGSYMTDLLVGYGLPVQALADAVAGYIDGILFPAVPNMITQSLGWDLGDPLPAATASSVGDYIKAQWAQKALVPDGLATLSPAATNFEVDTVFSNLTQVKDVWDSLISDLGNWLIGNTSLQASLNIDTIIYDDVIAWLPVVEPTVLAGVSDSFGWPNDNHYFRFLLSQWVEPGVVLGPPYDAGLIPGVTFELNLTDSIDSDAAMDLWNEFKIESEILGWYEAVDERGGTEYNTRMAAHGLTTTQMEEVCDYLCVFRAQVISQLNQMAPQVTLPIWGADIAQALNDIGKVLPVGGAVIALEGVFMIVLYVMYGRKRS